MDQRQLQYCLVLCLLLIAFLSGMTVEESIAREGQEMSESAITTTTTTIGDDELPLRRRLAIDPCVPDGQCIMCSASQRGKLPECDKTGNIQLFQCDAEGTVNVVLWFWMLLWLLLFSSVAARGMSFFRHCRNRHDHD